MKRPPFSTHHLRICLWAVLLLCFFMMHSIACAETPSVVSVFVKHQPESALFSLREDFYIGEGGKWRESGTNDYDTYYFTAEADTLLYLTTDGNDYLQICIMSGGEMQSAEHFTRYRTADGNLPHAAAPLAVDAGDLVAVSTRPENSFALYLLTEISGQLPSDSKAASTSSASLGIANYEMENGTELLAIYVPNADGSFLKYRFQHVDRPDRNADVWNMGVLSVVDSSRNVLCDVTIPGEWEMALHLEGRDDFSGGYMHGDERTTSMVLFLDGQVTPLEALRNTPFQELRIVQASTVYDPADHSTVIALHGSERVFTQNGLTISQSVVWQKDCTITDCFLAMLPASKASFDMMYTDRDYAPRAIALPYRADGVRKASVYKQGGALHMSMEIREYPSGYDGNGQFFISDNGGNPYSKMYFYAACGGNVAAGDVWKSETLYTITAP